MKRVSIIIPCYNQKEYIKEAIESALNQTYPDIEIIVINDGSTDNSAAIIKSFATRHNNIIFIDNKENKGVIYSRNIAIKAASGEYILPLDGDDKIDPFYAEKAVNIFENFSKRNSANDILKIVYCKTKLFGNNNEEFKLDKFSPDKIIFNNCIPNSAMFRKIDFVKAGGYKDYMKDGLEDWDLWLSLLENSQNKENCVYQIDEFLFYYRISNKITRNKCHDEIKKNELLELIFKNHIDLYLNNKEIIPRVFGNYENIITDYKNKLTDYEDIFEDYKNKLTNVETKLTNYENIFAYNKKKLKKYKKLYKLFLIISIIGILITAAIFLQLN